MDILLPLSLSPSPTVASPVLAGKYHLQGRQEKQDGTEPIAVRASKVPDLPLAHMQTAHPRISKSQACSSPKERWMSVICP